MQFVIFGKFNDKYAAMSPSEQKSGIEAEWAKSREYYSRGYLRAIWLFENDEGIMSLFDAESRDHMEMLLAGYPGMQQGFVTAEIRGIEPYSGFFPELAK
ncbi:muconolactone Delta-isomerase family protein [Stakelama tenebrarum]|uniref:Muconolactone isomerase domain-containing protein n=1 Tax=Stakelama tenebrarum TaxID=2711215 RepID=A0A6G6Y1X7_9SPHN|nr:muconolactone Delta-isomerase family protein [Sphingosinithalassobacter tenebrarum]QIG78613.1 hypothetical protein G5C33_01650 [Sphingosinithalassobacter tenebrarum]